MNIELSFTDTIQEFLLSEKESTDLISTVVETITAAAHRKWSDTARNGGLSQTRDLYLSNLKYYTEGDYKGIVILTGDLPNMIEQGTPPFDMKEGFEHAKNVQVKKGGGWYTTIPFRFASPGALGENPTFSSKLPKEIHKIIVKKDIDKPLKLTDLPETYKTPLTRLKLQNLKTNQVFEEYKNKTPIFQGLKKTEKTSIDKLVGGAKNTKYMTLRRVSDKSDPNSWIHRGFIAKNFLEISINNLNINNLVDKTIDDYLYSIGKR